MITKSNTDENHALALVHIGMILGDFDDSPNLPLSTNEASERIYRIFGVEMNKEEMSRAFSTDSSLFQFDLLTTQTDRIKSLFSLDKDEEVFTIYAKDGNIRVKGTSYDSIVCSQHSSDIVKEEDSSVVIYKKYLNLLDKENYQVIVCSNKVVFKSLDTDTVLTVAVAMMAED